MGEFQSLYLDRVTNWCLPNVTIVDASGAIYFETNEIGLKGDPIDPTRRLAVVWGDSVVFGLGRGWPCLLEDLLPGYQVLNGGIEGDLYESVLRRAVTLNREFDIALNIILLGWHSHGQNENVRTDLIVTLDNINNPILTTMPTALNRRIINHDLSHYFITGHNDAGFHFYGHHKYS